MESTRYQWTTPIFKSVLHLLDPVRFQFIVHSEIFAIEFIHYVFCDSRGISFFNRDFVALVILIVKSVCVLVWTSVG